MAREIGWKIGGRAGGRATLCLVAAASTLVGCSESEATAGRNDAVERAPSPGEPSA